MDVIVQRDKSKSATFSTIGCDTEMMQTTVVDKETDDKFDSGRESDETFDSESVKSESAAGEGHKQRPSDEMATEGTVATVRPSDKTRVTFWTDTYL
jgi:hypothetical protein